MENNIPKIPVFIDVDNLDVGAKEVLKTLRPTWIVPSQSERIKYKIFSDGLTNKLYGYYLEGEPEGTVIIKVYGVNTELMIDREMEIQTMKILQAKNLGPALYAIFENGIAYEFISGKTLDTENCQDPKISSLVAAEMGRFHSVTNSGESPEGKTSIIWEILARIDLMAEEALTTNPDLISAFEKLGIKSGFCKTALAELKTIIEKEDMPLGFCHNDLLLGNVIYNEKIPKVTFIDFEYCGLNYAPFDVANHFCEMAGGLDTDFSLCPDDSFKSKWIETYLQYLFGGKHSYDVKTFLRWTDICAPLSILGWIIWGIAQANNSKIDFDYIGYVAIRIPEYEKLMKKIRQ
jgi:ethanolamine kinase